MELEDGLAPLIQEVRTLKGRYLDSAIDWYQGHSKLPRVLFRVSGYAVIILSVSMPFLTTTTFKASNIVLSLVALVVAALTGISSFAQWDAQWRGYKKAQATLESLQAEWEMRLIEARHKTNLEEAREAVVEATRDILQKAAATVTAETETFFQSVKQPRAKAED